MSDLSVPNNKTYYLVQDCNTILELEKLGPMDFRDKNTGQVYSCFEKDLFSNSKSAYLDFIASLEDKIQHHKDIISNIEQAKIICLEKISALQS